MEPSRQCVVRTADISDSQIDGVLERAAWHMRHKTSLGRESETIGLVFLEPSLRTRIGFASAAYRLGVHLVEVDARRSSEESRPESVHDTVRTVSGYVDALIVRAGIPADRVTSAATVPWLNGGDTGRNAEHPSQALIDLFAIQTLVGPVHDLRITICGDLRMRAARSLLELLARRPPQSLNLATDQMFRDQLALPQKLDYSFGELAEPADVVYMGGIPHNTIDEAGRTRLRLDKSKLDDLGSNTTVLSPMPVIDEIAQGVRDDPRVKFAIQSDLGLYVRMAVLEMLLGRAS